MNNLEAITSLAEQVTGNVEKVIPVSGTRCG